MEHLSATFSACYICGFDEVDTTNMRRASTSRRSTQLTSPPPRSRSSERHSQRLQPFSDDEDEEQREDAHTRRRHVRAMSDPFDSQDDNVAAVVGAALLDHDVLPTMPRFPLAATRNKNCWSEPPVNIFQVRGPYYFSDKKKIVSDTYLLQPRGCDLFLSDKASPVEIEDKYVELCYAACVVGAVHSHYLLPRSGAILGGNLRRLPTLLVNFRFPWGFMILYFEIPGNLVPYMKSQNAPIDRSLTPAERTLAAWLMGDSDYKNERLKLIPYVSEGPWVVRNMVTGRPAIIGKKLPVTHEMRNDELLAPLLITTLDIGNSSATAKRIVSVCRRYMSALTVDLGFVIQAEEPHELPEQMLGSIRIHGPDPLKAVPLRK